LKLHNFVSKKNQIFLSICRSDTLKKVQQDNYRNRLIDEILVLCAGITGSGKTINLEQQMYVCHKEGYTTIFLTCKDTDPFASCYCQFPPQKAYHLNLLKASGINIETIPVQIYHPFTFDFPYAKKHPPYQFFSFGIKDLSELSLVALLGTEEDRLSVRYGIDNLKTVSNNVDLYDFLWGLKAKLAKQGVSFDKEKLFTGVGEPLDEKGLTRLISSFNKFRDNSFMQSQNFDLNLDYVNMINDNSKIHVLSTHFLKDKRLKYFVYITFLQNLLNALNSGRIKNKVFLVIEEVKTLLPLSGSSSYEKKLVEQLVDALCTIRTAGKGVYVVTSTQAYHQTNKYFRGSVNKNLFFNLSRDDMKALQDSKEVKIEQINILTSLNRGEFVFYEDLINDNKPTVKYKTFMPPFCHAEAEYDFYKMFTKLKPDEMIDFKDLFKRMKLLRKERETMALKRLKDFVKKKRSSDEAKKKERLEQSIEREKESVKKELVRSNIEKVRLEKSKGVYNLKASSPNLSWTALGGKFGVSGGTAKRYALAHAREVDDNEFIEKWA